MKRLHCPTCANEVFFDSLACVRCLTELVIEPDVSLTVSAIDTGHAVRQPLDVELQLALGARPTTAWPGAPAAASSTTAGGAATLSMVLYQAAQRRALYQLTELGVPWGGGAGAPLRFSYRSKTVDDEAFIGHAAARSRSTSTRPTRRGARRSGPPSASATARRSATSATSSATTCGWSASPPTPAHLEEFRARVR